MTKIENNNLISENLRDSDVLDFEVTDREKIRQCMYKRIAQGQALIDVEDSARREWGR